MKHRSLLYQTVFYAKKDGEYFEEKRQNPPAMG